METESVKSAYSEQSLKSRKSKHRNNHRSHSHRSSRSRKVDNNGMAPFQTAVTLSDDNRDGQEIIEVQILPQITARKTEPWVPSYQEWTYFEKDINTRLSLLEKYVYGH